MKTIDRSKEYFVRAYDELFYLAGVPIFKILPGSKIKTKLSRSDLVCYLMMVRFSHEGKRPVFVSANKLAKILGCHKDTVKRAWRKLEKAGLIERLCYQVAHRPSRQVQGFEHYSDAVEFLKKNMTWTFSTTKYKIKRPSSLFALLRKVKKERMAPINFVQDIGDGLPSFMKPPATAPVGVVANAPQAKVQKRIVKKRLILRKKELRVDPLISEVRQSRASSKH